MIFRKWKPKDKLVRSERINVEEPFDECPQIEPQILLIPMVAFTEDCHRIGYGGGYYDRTLEQLRK